MNKQTKIQQAIEKHLSSTADSLNKLSKKIDVSAATLSNIRNNKWDNISNDMWNKMAAYFNVQEDEFEWTLFQTTNFKRISNLCQDAKENKRMLAVSGFTGSGKTTALKTFAGSNPNTFYLLCTNVMGRREFVRGIQRAMGLEAEGSIAANIRSIVENLNNTEQPLLILDDAGKLTDANLRLIQLIYDETEFRAGIVLAGTEYLKSYIDKMAGKDKMGFRELKRRIQYWLPMDKISKNIPQIAQYHGIDQADAISFLQRSAMDFGTLRNYVTNAKRAQKKGFTAINAELLSSLSCGDFHINNRR